jgi:HK97 family phage prohead protease
MQPIVGEQYFRSHTAEIRRSSDDKRTVVKINTAERDTYNTVIEPQGGDISRYMRNPVVLINHDYNMPVTKTSSLNLTDTGWVATTEDDDWDKDDPEAMRWFRKVKSGLVKGASINFIPNKVERDDADPDDVFYRITRWELLEWSYVSVQANPSTVVSQRSVALELDSRVAEIETRLNKRFDELKELTEKIKSGFYRSTEEIISRIDELTSESVPPISTERVPQTKPVPTIRTEEVIESLTKRLDEMINRKLGRA